MNPRRYYHSGWIAAAAVVFGLFLLAAILSGQEMPPAPPVFAEERVIGASIPDYALLSPKASANTNDKACVTVIWDYSVPMPTAPKPVLASPRGAETIARAMLVVVPPGPSNIVLHTVDFTSANIDGWLLWSASPLDGADLQMSTNLVDWTSINDDPQVYSSEVVGYTSLADTNQEWRKLFFRAVPK